MVRAMVALVSVGRQLDFTTAFGRLHASIIPRYRLQASECGPADSDIVTARPLAKLAMKNAQNRSVAVTHDAELAQQGMRGLLYGEIVNTGLLDLFRPGERVLDVGCGTGSWAPALRGKGAETIVGIEYAPAAADQAELTYDRLVREPVENVALAHLGYEPFDTIIAADVIEHLVDPWHELRRWTKWLASDGQLIISVPNLRYVRIILSLIQGRFDYSDEGGLMDRTHLRWFTRRSLARELERAGWTVVKWGAPDGPRSRRLNRLTGGLLEDFLVPQIRAVAQLSR
jgi:2-polyprenyl-3-methyl-5-hydroxy-6-metoxy-1,4-benzoquinol methylase